LAVGEIPRIVVRTLIYHGPRSIILLPMNLGFDPEEIQLLKEECAEEGSNFVLVEDDMEMSDSGEMAHFQFVGLYEGKEVIYDAVINTLQIYHNSLVYEEAEKKVAALYKDFLPLEQRTEAYKPNEEAEILLEELIEEMEDEETIKVAEYIEIDPSFEYGVGLDVGLNVTEITVEVIEKFIEDFNAGTLQLDKTLYSFKLTDDE